MKKYINKGTSKKIILALIIVTVLNFMCPMHSYADVGGVLFDPISNLVTSIGDVILSALQYFLYDGSIDFTTSGISNIFGNVNTLDDFKNKYPDMQFDTSTTNALEIDKGKFTANLIDLVAGLFGGSTYVIPTIQYSIDKIFSGDIPALDINFITPSDYGGNTDMQEKSISYQISDIVAKWYNAIRNLAIIGLLSVLVYSGVRILISSSVDDRAKYKQRLFDWLVAMCLIFFMHYIMLFTITFVETLNDSLGNATTSIPVRIVDGGTTEAEFNTNLMGLVRLQVQYNDFTSQVTYIIFYVALLVYTVKFTWVYMKRLVTLMFLTIIAPLVAMTYPIDKLNDGKAQAFNAWLKEYIFTALIQPFHLIIYSVLVGSAINIVKINPIYAIMVIAFIGPAEKMLRKFFGFDKASTPGALSQAGAMFGGAAAMNMLKKGAGHFIDKKAGSGGKGGNGNVRTKPVEDKNSPDGYDAFAGNNQTQNRNTQFQNPNDDDYSNRAFLAQDEYNDNTQSTGEDWNDMYLNSQNYQSTDSGTGTTGLSATEELHGQAEGMDSTNNNSARNRNLLSKAGRLAAAPFTGTARTLKNTWSSKFANGRWKGTALNAAKKTAKFAGKAAVAGTVGAIGVGMGIAGDDLDDVLKYGAVGTALGYTMAPGLGRKIANTQLARNISKEAGIAIHGSVNATDVARQTQELRDSGELRNWAQETFLDKEGNKVEGKELNELENRAIAHYNDGFTDTSDIKKVMKLEDKMRKELQGNLPEEQANEKAREMSETIGKIAKDITPGKLSDQKYVEGKMQEFERGIKKSNPNLSDAEVRNNASQMMNYVMQYYKKP